MISPRYIIFSTLGILALSAAFVAGRLSHPDDSAMEPSGRNSSNPRALSNRSSSDGNLGGAIRSKSGSRSGKQTGGKKPEEGSGGRKVRLPSSAGSAEDLLSKRKVPLFKLEPPAEGNSKTDGAKDSNDQLASAKPARIGGKLQLNEELGKALGMTRVEYQAVNQTLNDTMEQMESMRQDSLEVRQRSDSQLFLKIRSFREEGAEMRTALEDGLRRQLGDERYASFMLMAEESLDQEYHQFGRAYQTISILGYNSNNDGQSRIRIEDEIHIPQGGGTRTIIQTRGNYDTLPEQYQAYLDVGPADPSPDAAPTVSPNVTPTVAPNPTPTVAPNPIPAPAANPAPATGGLGAN